MVKGPVPGHVKTRLTPPLTPEEAATLYRAFVLDTFSRVSTISDIDIIAPYSPHSEEDEGVVECLNVIPKGITVTTQKGRDLGERLFNVFKWAFSHDYRRVVIIGSDSPDIPLDYIEEAFRELENKDIVLGPTSDGGYYLVGMRILSIVPFTGIKWSTPSVFGETLKRIRATDMKLSILKEWHDIDTPEDLEALKTATQYDSELRETAWVLKGL